MSHSVSLHENSCCLCIQTSLLARVFDFSEFHRYFLHLQNESDLYGLVQVMIIIFGEQPPVYAVQRQEAAASSLPYPTQPSGPTRMLFFSCYCCGLLHFCWPNHDGTFTVCLNSLSQPRTIDFNGLVGDWSLTWPTTDEIFYRLKIVPLFLSRPREISLKLWTWLAVEAS